MKQSVKHWKIYYGGFWHHFVDFRRYRHARLRWGQRCVVELVAKPIGRVRRVRWDQVIKEADNAKPVLVSVATENCDEIFRRARRKMYARFYSLVWYNCEHFANECMWGRPRSHQVRKTLFELIGTAVSVTGCFAMQESLFDSYANGIGFLFLMTVGVLSLWGILSLIYGGFVLSRSFNR